MDWVFQQVNAAAAFGAHGDKDRSGTDDDDAIEVIGADLAYEGANTTACSGC